jgi:ankyrin repeat protein
MLSAIEKEAGLKASWGDVVELRAAVQRYPAIINAPEFLYGGTLLHGVASSGSLEKVKLLVDVGFDVNYPSTRDGITAINHAVTSGNIDVVRFLLDNEAKLPTEKSIQNPLFAAISAYTSVTGRKLSKEVFSDIVHLLLKAGIDASVRYNSDTMLDMDAMAFACMWGRQDIAQILAEHLFPGDVETQTSALERAAVSAKRTTAHNDSAAKAQDYA